MGARGEAPRKCLRFALAGPLETRFLGKKTQEKKKNPENYFTTYKTLKSRFICQHRKTILKIEFQKFNLRLSVFAVCWTEKSAGNNPWSCAFLLQP